MDILDIKRFIYEFNLASTDTVNDRYEWLNIVNDNIDMKFNYKNCVSLYHLVDSFNKLYVKFKKDRIEYPNINIKGDKRIGWYDGDKNSKYERFTMFINNSDILYLERVNDKYRSYYIKVEDDLEDDFEEINVSLSDEDIKKYLEIGSKYSVLIEGYNYFKYRKIFGNGISMIFTKINEDLFNGCNSFEITLGNASMNCEDYINIIFKLGDKLEIDYDNSIVKLSGEIIRDKNMIIDQFVKNIYVNKNVFLSTDDIDYEKINSNIKKMLPNS